MKLRNIVSAAALICAVGQAQATVLECKLNPGSAGGGYVTELYYFEFAEGDDKASAADALIQYYNKGPVVAKISSNTAKKLAISWKVQITNSTGQQTNMQFRAAYFKGNKSVTVRATPPGYANSFEARGTCRETR